MSSDVLLEEFEVLESIYPDEFIKLSERNIRIDVEPDDLEDGEETLTLALTVSYTDEYPDVLPELGLQVLDGELEGDEQVSLLHDMRTVGEENLGMAMTFTIVSHLREQLSALIRTRSEHRRKVAADLEQKALEAEEARTRGTPVTVATFLEWKAKFDKEMALKKAREDEERIKGLTAKEKEEYRKIGTRLSGRQLFERDKNLDIADDSLLEEGTVSVDISQYERNRESDDEDEGHVNFSDSD